VLSADGYIVTNAHVVEGALRLEVLLPPPPGAAGPGRSILKPVSRRVPARIVGVDPETDLAVLKVDAGAQPFLSLGDSDDLRPGQLVLAFGSPLGLENSVTMGVVSAVARQLTPESRMVYLQTDTPINPGNSGGPLVNTAGEVVGINTLIFSQSGGSEGIGFAAPANIVRQVFGQIRAHGRVHRGEIGVNAQTITPTLAAGLGLGREWGVILADVLPGSAAAEAGLIPGDVVLALDGKEMENGRQLDVNLYRRPVGEQVTLDVLRGVQRLSVRVAVRERAEDQTPFAQLVTPEKNLVPELGILAIEVTQELERMLPWRREPRGVLVAARAADAPYSESGPFPGDIIAALNGTPTPGLVELRQRLAGIAPGAAMVLRVNRRGQYVYVALSHD
jgi:serine protease Do